MKQPKLPNKKKPSDYLEAELRKKELELNFIKEVFENKQQINQVLTKNNLEDLNIIPKKTQKKAATPKDFLEKVEKEKIKREEKEKLRMLEKLEAQVLGKKTKKLSAISNTTSMSNFSKQNTQNSVNKQKDNPWKIDKKLLDDQEFRKTIKKEKIEIDCENPLIEDDKLEKDFIDNLSKEKLKFFLFKVRDVYDFLESIKLVRFIEIFIEDGIEDMECILEIDDDYFEERKFPPQIEKRIKAKIDEIKVKKKIKSNINCDGEILTKEELNKNNDKHKYLKEYDKNNSFYDEEEQARLFRQAVEEFRNAGKENMTPLNNNSPQEDLGTNPDPNANILPANKPKKCCWNCLKVILSETALEQYFEEKVMKFKDFCSENCLNTYKEKIYSSCDYCNKRIEKGVGKYFDDKWFCEELCLEEYIKENGEDLLVKYKQEDEEIEAKTEAEIQLEAEADIKDHNYDNDADNDYDPMLDF